MKRSPVLLGAIFIIPLALGVIVFASSPPVVAVRRGIARALRPLMRAVPAASRAACGTCADEQRARETAEARLAQSVGENTSLKKLLGLKQEFAPSLVPARVLAYNQEWDREWLIIDVGAADGVKVGDVVIDEHEFLVGDVVEAGTASATVAVASDKGTAFGVGLVPSGGEALAHGMGARAFHLELIPRDTPVRPGDMVMRIIKSNKKIPPTYAGRIASVDDRAGGAFKTANAILLAHPEQADRLIVIKAL